MARSIIILSSIVDSTIKESLSQDRVIIFNTIQELRDYVESTPVRAETMYITREILNPSINTSLAVLMSLLSNPFLVVDEVLYITEKGSKELPSIDFMLEENKELHWETHLGTLSRDYITSLISGTMRLEDFRPTRVSVFRQKKSEYLKSRLNENMKEKYPADEDKLADIPEEEVTPAVLHDAANVCKIITVSGLPEKERTLFAFLLAQYLSFQGKTIIVERDYDYLTLTDMMSRSEIVYKSINIKDIYYDASKVLRAIRTCTEQLVLVTETDRVKHDYSFVCNFLYNNLGGNLAHIVIEKDLDEIAPTTDLVIAIPANVVDVLKTVERVPQINLTKAQFAMINMKSVGEISIPNTSQSKQLLEDLFQVDNIKVQNINIKSLRLSGEAHDLSIFTK